MVQPLPTLGYLVEINDVRAPQSLYPACEVEHDTLMSSDQDDVEARVWWQDCLETSLTVV